MFQYIFYNEVMETNYFQEFTSKKIFLLYLYEFIISSIFGAFYSISFYFYQTHINNCL